MRPIETSVELADDIIKAACCLHNFIITEKKIPNNFADHGTQNEENGAWRLIGAMPSCENFRNTRANHARNEAVQTRNILTNYFVGNGAVEWQDKMI